MEEDFYIPETDYDDYPCFLSLEEEIDRDDTLERIREKEFFDSLDEYYNQLTFE